MKTPYYLIDTEKLLKNLLIVEHVRRHSGAKCLLALKCFSMWGIFDQMAPYLDGTTSSSLYEARLGHEKFGGETHAYSVAFCDQDMAEVITYADKIIFNSISQLNQHKKISQGKSIGLRVNPNISYSDYPLADPCRQYSRLGEHRIELIEPLIPDITGFMMHVNCDNESYNNFDKILTAIEHKFGFLLHQLEWLSLGGGISFTSPNYPLAKFCERLKKMAKRYNLQIYLEPGQAVLEEAGSLEVSIVDIINNSKNIAVVDSSIQAHMIDLLVYNYSAEIHPNRGNYVYEICGSSCLAGDIFGEYHFPEKLQIGDRISFKNAVAYTSVNKNWFNGLRMPSIAIKNSNGIVKCIKTFDYVDFLNSQS